MKVEERGGYLEGSEVMLSVWDVQLPPDPHLGVDVRCLVVYRAGQAEVIRVHYPYWEIIVERAAVPDGERWHEA